MYSAVSSLSQLVCRYVVGAVGGQPDVLNSVDTAAEMLRRTAAEMLRHSSDADSPSLSLLQNTATPSSTVQTVVTVESRDKPPVAHNGLEASQIAVSTVAASALQQRFDPVRYYLVLLTSALFLCFTMCCL